MTDPGHRFAKCRCSHTKERHDTPGFDGECVADGCKCRAYRPQIAEATTARTTPAGLAHTPPAPPVPRPPLAAVPPQPSGQTPAPTGPSLEQLVAAGKRSDVKRTKAIAAKLEAFVTELRERLAAERQVAEFKTRREAEKEAARAEIAALEKELADARAKLRGTATPPAKKAGKPRPVTTGSFTCKYDGCDRTFPTSQGAALHLRRTHQGFNPSVKEAG